MQIPNIGTLFRPSKRRLASSRCLTGFDMLFLHNRVDSDRHFILRHRISFIVHAILLQNPCRRRISFPAPREYNFHAEFPKGKINGQFNSLGSNPPVPVRYADPKIALNDTLKKPTPGTTAFAKASVSQELRGIYGFLPFGTGCRPTRCFFRTLQQRPSPRLRQSRATGNDQVQQCRLQNPGH